MSAASLAVFAIGTVAACALMVIAVWLYLTKAEEFTDTVGLLVLALFSVGVFATAAAMAGSIG